MFLPQWVETQRHISCCVCVCVCVCVTCVHVHHVCMCTTCVHHVCALCVCTTCVHMHLVFSLVPRPNFSHTQWNKWTDVRKIFFSRVRLSTSFVIFSLSLCEKNRPGDEATCVVTMCVCTMCVCTMCVCTMCVHHVCVHHVCAPQVCCILCVSVHYCFTHLSAQLAAEN